VKLRAACPGRCRVWVGAALTKPGRVSTARWCGSGERDGKEYGQEPASTSLKGLPAPNLADMGRVRCAILPVVFWLVGVTPGWSCGCLPGGHGEVLRVSHGDAAGAQLDSSFVERTAVNTGTFPALPLGRAASTERRLGPSSTDRVGKGRSRRSTRGPGEPVTWGRAAAVMRREGNCDAERSTSEHWRS
jgi:hypothetical protein